MPVIRVVAFVAFVGTVFAANALTEHYGMVSVGFGLTATAGTYAAGLAFGFRDVLHESGGRHWRYWVLGAIALGALVSAIVSPALALASGCAFAVSELADLAAYEPLRRRQWIAAVIVSGIVGAFVDTLLFLWLAPFPVTRDAVAGQMLAKGLMIIVALPLVWRARRALPRYGFHGAGA